MPVVVEVALVVEMAVGVEVVVVVVEVADWLPSGEGRDDGALFLLLFSDTKRIKRAVCVNVFV